MLLSGLLDTVKRSKYFIVWAKLQQQVCFEGRKSNSSKFDSEAELERSLLYKAGKPERPLLSNYLIFDIK